MKSTIIFTVFSAIVVAQARLIPRQNNLQPFTGDIGAAATPVTDSGNADRPFAVKGDTFVNLAAALQRSCDQQFNACANLANAGSADFSVQDCSTQKGKSEQ